MKMNYLAVIGLVAVAYLSGCTRSLEVAYQADAARLSNAAALDKITLGVAKFEDKRAWFEEGNPQSESYVSMQGPWKFGLTYKETDYMPVKDIIQDVLVQELTKAGFKAKAVDKVLSKSNSQSIKDIRQDQASDYILGGQILAFEFANQPGMWTVTNRRSVILDINLFKSGDAQLIMETPIAETVSQEYAMGVSHSVCAYNLINEVLKKAVRQIIQKTAESISQKQAQGQN